MATSFDECFFQVWALRSVWIVILALLALLPLIFVDYDDEIPEKAKRCLYVLATMAVLWVTEALPISVTALLPLVMFPLSGVMTAKETSEDYVNNTSMLFLGGLMVAVAVEEWNLHKRISMMILMLVGSDPKWIMAGMMVATWFLSMWISNTATASMMIPIADAVLQQIKRVDRDPPPYSEGDFNRNNSDNSPNEDETVVDAEMPSSNGKESIELKDVKVQDQEQPAAPEPDRHTSTLEAETNEGDETGHQPVRTRFSKGLTLCIAYGANIGGIATLTGTPPNLVLQGLADEIYNGFQRANGTEETGSPISFSNWMGFAFPLSLLTLVLAWILLVLFFVIGTGCCTISPEQSKAVKQVIHSEFKKLGKITLAEAEVLVLFVLLAILWISRDLKEVSGWSVWFKSGYVSDSTSAMLIVLLMFILPAKVPNVFCLQTPERAHEPYYTPLLTWEKVSRRVPWGVIILLGGGFALASGVKKSGLAAWVALKLEELEVHFDRVEFNLILCLLVALITEFTSNTATASLLLPLLAELAISLGENPLYFMVSATVATSFAFMMPAATPPNAIIFSYGSIRVIYMVIVGFCMNVIAVGCLTLAVNTWGKEIYDFDYLDPIFSKE